MNDLQQAADELIDVCRGIACKDPWRDYIRGLNEQIGSLERETADVLSAEYVQAIRKTTDLERLRDAAIQAWLDGENILIWKLSWNGPRLD